jgi:hypothetical protein
LPSTSTDGRPVAERANSASEGSGMAAPLRLVRIDDRRALFDAGGGDEHDKLCVVQSSPLSVESS